MHSSGKTPLIRLAKRDGMAGAGQWGIRIAAILLALVVGGLVILLSGNNPIQGYAIIVEGALGKTSGIRQTVKNFIPLLGTALAIAPCFKMRFWNIGAEGQITAGAMCATYFALFWADSIPQVPLLLIMCAAGAIGGGLWAVWGVITLAGGLKDQNGPATQSGVWQVVGGGLIIAAAALFSNIAL